MPWTGDPSIADLILDNVVATLQAITVANGYELDVQEVTRKVIDVDAEILNKRAGSKTPFHMVLRSNEGTVPSASGGQIRASLGVTDWMVVKYEDVERAIKDVKRAMWLDRHRGTHPTTGNRLALDTGIPSIETVEGVTYPFELVIFEFAIDYVHLEGAP